MRPTLEVLDEKGRRNRKQLMDHLAAVLSITEAEQAELLPSGQAQTFSNRVRWATTYMGKADLISRPEKGVHEITVQGRETLATHPGPIHGTSSRSRVHRLI
jgi:restriction system protein